MSVLLLTGCITTAKFTKDGVTQEGGTFDNTIYYKPDFTAAQWGLDSKFCWKYAETNLTIPLITVVIPFVGIAAAVQRAVERADLFSQCVKDKGYTQQDPQKIKLL